MFLFNVPEKTIKLGYNNIYVARQFFSWEVFDINKNTTKKLNEEKLEKCVDG